MNNQYKQLTQKERYQIHALKELGFSARKIAKTLQRSNKTISRELGFAGIKPYCAEEADNLAYQKRTHTKKHIKCKRPANHTY